MKLPTFEYEEKLWKEGMTVIGIDEVGRGAFAGPVCVAGVVFPSDMSLATKKHLMSLGINDSKKLSPKKREELSFIIKKSAKVYSIEFIDVPIINKIGIGKATFLGMEEVVQAIISKLQTPKSYLLIDGFKIPSLETPQSGIIRGDSLSISIAAASIIAKVARDKVMVELGLNSPKYGWKKNKGYGTLEHRRAIEDIGLTEFHRVEFCRKTLSHLSFGRPFSTI